MSHRLVNLCHAGRISHASMIVTLAVAVLACAGPTLDEQRAQILNDDIQYEKQTINAFLDVWGKPTYIHRARTQFYEMEDGNWLPQFRLKLAEPPEGWTNKFNSNDAVFFGYPDRGELLGFVEDKVVYREHVTAEEVHAIGKRWQHEDRFKTRLELPGAISPR